ncbi:MAG: BrnT family toxin [Thermoanaerobaculia bacterium]
MNVFDWDERKAVSNERKHGVSFDEARSVFDDNDLLSGIDHEHSIDELRFMIVGRSDRERLLAVWITYRDSFIRIIGARRATPKERKTYEEKNRRRR